MTVDGDRVTGVETAQGEVFSARQAVVGSIHPYDLRKHFPNVDAGVLARAEAVQLSLYGVLTMHHALHEPLRYRSSESDELQKVCMLEMVPSDMGEFRRYFDDLRYQRMSDPLPAMVATSPSVLDPSRAPAGKATGCMIAFAPWNLNGEGPEAWATHRERIGQSVLGSAGRWVENLTPDNIIATCMHTPVDMDKYSPSFRHGDVHGCGPYFYQMNGHRPTPDLANYTVPGVDRFYLTGPFMHPGGGVFGGGRATVVKMFNDLGMDFEKAATPMH